LKRSRGLPEHQVDANFRDLQAQIEGRVNRITVAQPELGAMIRASEMVCDSGSRKSPAFAIVRANIEGC
jgi:hypothetical protein